MREPEMLSSAKSLGSFPSSPFTGTGGTSPVTGTGGTSPVTGTGDSVVKAFLPSLRQGTESLANIS